MNNIYIRDLSGGFSFIKTSLLVILLAGAFLSLIPTESNAKPRIIPVNVVLDFSSGGSKSAMVSTDNLQLIFECDSTGAGMAFTSFNGNAVLNYTSPIVITPKIIIGKDTSNQADIFSTFLVPDQLVEVPVISEADDPGNGQMVTFGPGVLSHVSGEAMILSSGQATFNLLGNDICSYTGNISIID